MAQSWDIWHGQLYVGTRDLGPARIWSVYNTCIPPIGGKLKMTCLAEYEDLWTKILGCEPSKLSLKSSKIIKGKTVSAFRITSETSQFKRFTQELTETQKPRILTCQFLNPRLRVEIVLVPDCPELQALGLVDTVENSQTSLNIIFVATESVDTGITVLRETWMNGSHSSSTSEAEKKKLEPNSQNSKGQKLTVSEETSFQESNNPGTGSDCVGKASEMKEKLKLQERKERKCASKQKEIINLFNEKESSEVHKKLPEKSPKHKKKLKLISEIEVGEHEPKTSAGREPKEEDKPKKYLTTSEEDLVQLKSDRKKLARKEKEKSVLEFQEKKNYSDGKRGIPNVDNGEDSDGREENNNNNYLQQGHGDLNKGSDTVKVYKPFKWHIKRFVKKSNLSNKCKKKKANSSAVKMLNVVKSEAIHQLDLTEIMSGELDTEMRRDSPTEAKSHKASRGQKFQELLSTRKLQDIFSLRDTSKPDLIKPSMLKKHKDKKANQALGSASYQTNFATPDLLKSTKMSKKKKYEKEIHDSEAGRIFKCDRESSTVYNSKKEMCIKDSLIKQSPQAQTDDNVQPDSDASCRTLRSKGRKRSDKSYDTGSILSNTAQCKPKTTLKKANRSRIEWSPVNLSGNNRYEKDNPIAEKKKVACADLSNEACADLSTEACADLNTEACADLSIEDYVDLSIEAYADLFEAGTESNIGVCNESSIAVPVRFVSDKVVKQVISNVGMKRSLENGKEPAESLINPRKKLRIVLKDVMKELLGVGIYTVDDALRSNIKVSSFNKSLGKQATGTKSVPKPELEEHTCPDYYEAVKMKDIPNGQKYYEMPSDSCSSYNLFSQDDSEPSKGKGKTVHENDSICNSFQDSGIGNVSEKTEYPIEMTVTDGCENSLSQGFPFNHDSYTVCMNDAKSEAVVNGELKVTKDMNDTERDLSQVILPSHKVEKSTNNTPELETMEMLKEQEKYLSFTSKLTSPTPVDISIMAENIETSTSTDPVAVEPDPKVWSSVDMVTAEYDAKVCTSVDMVTAEHDAKVCTLSDSVKAVHYAEFRTSIDLDTVGIGANNSGLCTDEALPVVDPPVYEGESEHLSAISVQEGEENGHPKTNKSDTLTDTFREANSVMKIEGFGQNLTSQSFSPIDSAQQLSESSKDQFISVTNGHINEVMKELDTARNVLENKTSENKSYMKGFYPCQSTKNNFCVSEATNYTENGTFQGSEAPALSKPSVINGSMEKNKYTSPKSTENIPLLPELVTQSEVKSGLCCDPDISPASAPQLGQEHYQQQIHNRMMQMTPNTLEVEPSMKSSESLETFHSTSSGIDKPTEREREHSLNPVLQLIRTKIEHYRNILCNVESTVDVSRPATLLPTTVLGESVSVSSDKDLEYHLKVKASVIKAKSLVCQQILKLQTNNETKSKYTSNLIHNSLQLNMETKDQCYVSHKHDECTNGLPVPLQSLQKSSSVPSSYSNYSSHDKISSWYTENVPLDTIMFRPDESYEPDWSRQTIVSQGELHHKYIHLFHADQQDTTKIKCLLLTHAWSYATLDELQKLGGHVYVQPNAIRHFLAYVCLKEMCEQPSIQFGIYNSLSAILNGTTISILKDSWLILLHHSAMDNKSLDKVLAAAFKCRSDATHNKVFIPVLTLKQCVIRLTSKQKHSSEIQEKLDVVKRNLSLIIECVNAGVAHVIGCEGPWRNLGPKSSVSELVSCLQVIHRCLHYVQRHAAVLVDDSVMPSRDQQHFYGIFPVSSFVHSVINS